MSSRKERSMDNGGITFTARRLSSADSKDMADQGGGGDDGSLQQQYSIPRFVSKVYYRLGLLCASHPRFVLILAFIVIVWSCFPLFSLPIYSTRPQINVQSFQYCIICDDSIYNIRQSYGDFNNVHKYKNPTGKALENICDCDSIEIITTKVK